MYELARSIAMALLHHVDKLPPPKTPPFTLAAPDYMPMADAMAQDLVRSFEFTRKWGNVQAASDCPYGSQFASPGILKRDAD
ncbi:hypothetical protein [Nitrospirillum bahiense]|uniref:Uncharacterized protein n=1 Tax=Nitrospirillum amazonense TaxID=28077 RepID=A0A560F1U8_9PROT|nr:hypothetical protein [Nitrospirillum amazonense]TWB15581.1 hypothetical protein FBZ88_12934 [Nitrospirillum amazonense]